MSSIDSAVFVSVVMLLLKISFCSTFVFSFWCIDLHSFSTCSCVSFSSPQPLHVMLLYLPRKLFFMSSIRVLALNIVLTWNLFSWFIYFGRIPTFQLLIPSSRCFTFDLEFPALFILFLKSLSITSVTLFFCWCFVVSFFSSSVVVPIFSIVCMVMFFQFWLLSMSVIVDIRLFLFFSILFIMFIIFCVLLDSMSFSPVSMYVASLGVDVGTMSIRLIMLSSTWSICFVSFLLGFHSSLPYVIMGMIHV